MKNLRRENSCVIEDSNPEHIIEPCNVYKELHKKFSNREVTVQFNGCINIDIDVNKFDTYDIKSKDRSNLIFLVDESKPNDNDDNDILSINEDDIICAMHGVYDDINIYLKNGELLQIYGYEEN